MFSTVDATSDEPVLGAVPTTGELGRQVKRLKTSTILNSVTETLPTVPDDMIGARFARAADMAAEMAVNLPGEVPRHRDLLIAITNTTRQLISDSCAPGGAFYNCVASACQPGGLVSACVEASVATACQPGGLVSACVEASVAAVEQRSMSRLHNGTKHGGAELLQPLLGVNNRFPADFPRTYDSFARMSGACSDSLILAYGLPSEGTAAEKLRKLSAYCNVNLPK